MTTRPRGWAFLLALAVCLSPALAGEPAAGPDVPAAPAAPAGPARPSPGPSDPTGRKVVDVVVEGLVTVKPEVVLKAMATRKGQPFYPSTYREDFDRVFALGLFDNVILGAPEPIPGGLRVRVTCLERPVIDAVELAGNEEFRARTLLDRARKDKAELSVGGRYDLHAANQMANSIRKIYSEDRYALVEVTPSSRPVPGKPGHVTVRFTIKEDRPVEIGAVVFLGRKAVPEGDLLDAITSKPPVWYRRNCAYDPEVLRLDAMRIQDVYRNRGYSDARVELLEPELPDPSGWRRRRFATVTFDIREGKLYTYGPVSFTGLVSAIEEEARMVVENAGGLAKDERGALGRLEKARRLGQGEKEALQAVEKIMKRADRDGIVVGKPYSEEEVSAAVQRLRDLFGEKGRPFAQVIARRESGAEPQVTGLRFLVREGPEAVVGEVRIKGNSTTRDRIIRRELAIFPGDVYDARKVETTEYNLRRRGIFEKVTARAVPGDEPETADLEIEVEETTTGRLGLGVGVSTDTGEPFGQITLGERNLDYRRMPANLDDLLYGGAFRGGAQQATLGLSAAQSSRSIYFDFTNPWIFDTPGRWGVGFTLAHQENEYDQYDVTRDVAAIRVGRRLFGLTELRGYTQYKLQNVLLGNVDSDLPEDIRQQEGYTLYSSGKLGLIYDSRDSLMVPTKGWLFEVGEEVFGGPFGGDQDFRKSSAEGNLFLPLWRTEGTPSQIIGPLYVPLPVRSGKFAHVLHLRAAADLANPYGRQDYIPVDERYYAGGIGMVRGFAPRTLSPRVDDEIVGGRFRMVESADYVFPLWDDHLRGDIFFDNGNVWTDEGDFEWHDQRRSTGFGLHIKTPAAMGGMPIKLYFCHAINPADGEATRFFQMTFSFLF